MEIIHPSEITSERFNNTRDFLVDVIKRSKDWKVSYGIAPIAESYARGDVELHLCLFLHLDSEACTIAMKNGDGKRKRVYPANLRIRAYWHANLDFRATPKKSSNLTTTHRSKQNWDEPMFIGIIQFTKEKKRAMQIPMPSFVWLKSLNAYPISPMDTFKTPRAFPLFTPKAICPFSSTSTNIEYWEGRINGGSRCFQQSKLPSQEVERRTQVVGDFTDYNAPLFGKFGRASLYYNRIVSSLFIEFGSSNDIGILCEEPFRIFLQGYELCFCPLDLSSWPIEWMHSSLIPSPHDEFYHDLAKGASIENEHF